MMHGYHVEPIQVQDQLRTKDERSPKARGEMIVRKLADVADWAKTSMAVAQQTQEDQANRRRDQAPRFEVGDKVWLSLRNVRTKRPSKKLDRRNAKYTVTKVVGTHSYELNTPPGVHNVFHAQLLRPAASDPLPSQRTIDTQPPPEFVDRVWRGGDHGRESRTTRTRTTERIPREMGRVRNSYLGALCQLRGYDSPRRLLGPYEGIDTPYEGTRGVL